MHRRKLPTFQGKAETGSHATENKSFVPPGFTGFDFSVMSCDMESDPEGHPDTTDVSIKRGDSNDGDDRQSARSLSDLSRMSLSEPRDGVCRENRRCLHHSRPVVRLEASEKSTKLGLELLGCNKEKNCGQMACSTRFNNTVRNIVEIHVRSTSSHFVMVTRSSLQLPRDACMYC